MIAIFATLAIITHHWEVIKMAFGINIRFTLLSGIIGAENKSSA